MRIIKSSMIFFSILTIPAVLTGCGDDSSIFEDNDGDGYSATDGDCDDTNPDINPDAEEIWYDGFDQNCDNADDFDADGDGDIGGASGTDCDDADSSLNTNDVDDDGFSTCDDDCDDTEPAAFPGAAPLEANEGCYLDLDMDGFGSYDPEMMAGIEAGTDCNDNMMDINPGTEEIWYNGTDENCDSNDADQDNDGDQHEDYGGGDCNDMDSNVSSYEQEVGGNAIDENCDGRVSNNASTSVTFADEGQVTEFCGSYDRINGDLLVDYTTIVSLDLSCLAGVTGSITISNNDYLESINLSELTILQHMYVEGNNVLETLDVGNYQMLDNGSFYFAQNPTLTTIDFSSLELIKDGNFIVSDNTSLMNMLVPSLTMVQDSTVQFWSLPSISDLDLSALNIIEGGYTFVGDMLNLTNMDIQSLEKISGGAYVSIQSNETLQYLGAPLLSDIEGTFELYNNQQVTEYNFPGLKNILSGALYVSLAPSLTSFDLSSLENMSQAALVFYQTGLTVIELYSLLNVSYYSQIQVYDNDQLTKLVIGSNGAGTSITDSYLTIQQNQLLSDIDSLYYLSSASGSELTITDNNTLCTSDVVNIGSYLRWLSFTYYGNGNC